MPQKFPNIAILFFLFFFLSLNCYSQGNFEFKEEIKKESVGFELINNLIVFPIEVNGKKLNFILDSGVGSTILFNLNEQDSIHVKNTEKIKLMGLGSEEPVDAILSNGNKFQVKNIISQSQRLYVISNDNFDLSSKLGKTIHGIIGYEILKDFVVKINYSTKSLTFYKSTDYKYKNCKKCETYNLQFYRNKPYINVGVKFKNEADKIIPVKLLIDSGGSDAMWLFENSHPDIQLPDKYFDDFLGEGLSGSVYGKRSSIYSLVLGKHELIKPTVSFPDSISVAHALKFKDRNGSLGANILKRFIVVFDYKKGMVHFQRSSNFKEPFRYNMSGIELVYNGKILVKEKDKGAITYADGDSGSHTKVTLDFSYKFVFKPTYRIEKVRVGSPAYQAGIQAGDILIKIGTSYSYNLQLEEIVAKFYQKENTKINLVIERNGLHYRYSFRLKDMLK